MGIQNSKSGTRNFAAWRTNFRQFAFCALTLALLFLGVSGCKSGPEPVYEGPAGQGRLRYDPKRGIVREGTQGVASEQKLYEAAERAFQERRWEECITYCIQLT